jgi:hypothetical protein
MQNHSNLKLFSLYQKFCTLTLGCSPLPKQRALFRRLPLEEYSKACPLHMSEGKPKSFRWNPFQGRSRRCKIIVIAVVLFICVAAALLGWGIHKAVQKTYNNMAVILPLYIYPFEGVWDPLYTA